MNKTKTVLKELFKRSDQHHLVQFAAQTAYFVMLSIFPFIILLLMLLTSLSLSYTSEIEYLNNVLPGAVIDILIGYLEYSSKFSDAVFSPILITALWMSTNGIIALMNSLNMAYEIKETRNYFQKKLIAMFMLILVLSLIVVALVIPNIGDSVLDFIRKFIYIPAINRYILLLFKSIILIATYFIVLSLIYFILPNKKLRYKGIMPGTIFASVGLALISYFFQIFVREFSKYSLVYGSISAIIVVLIWLYLCAIILILGGEFNAILYEKYKKDSSL